MTTAPVTTLPTPSFASFLTPAAEVGPPRSILLYGDTGTRKTTMYAELVVAGVFKKMLYLDLDNGSETLFIDPEIRAAVEDGRIQILQIDPLDAMAFEKLDAVIQEVAGVTRTETDKYMPDPSKPDLGYDLVVLDTLNLAQDVAANHFMHTTFAASGKPDSLKAWGRVGVWTDSTARLFHNNKRFVGGFAMHARTDTENTGKVSIKPKLSGGTKDSIATIPSVVAYLDFEKNPETNVMELVATVGESDTYTSKNRYRLQSKIRNFNLVTLYDLIDEASKTTATPAAA